jgi:hypothetical protein
MPAVAQPRPFNREALKPYAVPWLTPNVSNWSAVWRYTVLVPVEQIQADGTTSRVATDTDIESLELMFIEIFGGITRPEKRFGRGARDPRRPKETLESNVHEVFQVYAPNAAASDQFFQALRFELQEALVEGQVLIEREDVLLL